MHRSRFTTMFMIALFTGTGLGSCTQAHTEPLTLPAANGEPVSPDPEPLPSPPQAEPAPADTPHPAHTASTAGAGVAGGAVEPAASEPRTYTVVGVGDIMMGSDWPQPGMDPRVVPGGSPTAVIGDELAAVFSGADVVFGNYEGTIHTSDENAKTCGNPEFCYVFRSPSFHADFLRSAGFTILSNANNHARDFGETGRRATYNALTNAGFAVAGADAEGMRIGVQTLEDGRRVALVAFGHNPGLLMVQDYGRVAAMVRQADAMADIVMVSCHIGAEGSRYDRVTRATEMFLNEDRGNPYRFAHAAVDAGADIVFCHGPHIPRAVEVYRGRFIAYSLGNFWTYGRFNLNGVNGLAPVARLEVDGDGALVSAEIVSARQERPGGPMIDATGAAARVIATLTARDFPETGTRVDAAGRVSWPN